MGVQYDTPHHDDKFIQQLAIYHFLFIGLTVYDPTHNNNDFRTRK